MIDLTQLAGRASIILGDEDNVRWPVPELADWGRDAIRQIVSSRPDAFAKTVSVTLAAGKSHQSVPAKALRLMRVSHNEESGEPIREGSRVVLDSEVPGWHRASSSADWSGVEMYVYDNANPEVFWVYPAPPMGSAHKISVVCAMFPDETHNQVDVPAHYASPIIDWMVYRAISKDVEYAGNSQRASMHLDAFVRALGLNRESEFEAAIPAAATPTRAGVGG